MRRYSGIMGRILGQKPTTMPQCVVDSLAFAWNEDTISESPEVSE